MSEPVIEIDPAAGEPPLLSFVRDYWHRARGSRAMPGRGDIAPSELKAHLRHILLADVVNGGQDFRYRLVGSELNRYFAGNPTGMLMSDVLAPFGADTVARTITIYRAAAERRAPLRVRGAGALFDQGPKFFDALLAPLSDDGLIANMIFGTFVFEWDMARQYTPDPRAEIGEAELATALRGNR